MRGALRPTCGGRGSTLRPRSPADEAINPNHQTIAQRKERSTPTVRRVSSGGRACHSSRQTWTGDEGPASTPSSQPVLPAKGLSLRLGSIPSWATAWRANHPRGQPVRQGSRTRVSVAGNPGKSLTTHQLSPLRNDWGRALQAPFRKLPPDRSPESTATGPHLDTGYRRQRPQLRRRSALRTSSALLRALRVS